MGDVMTPTGWAVKVGNTLATGYPSFEFAAADALRYKGVVVDGAGNEIDPVSVEPAPVALMVADEVIEEVVEEVVFDEVPGDFFAEDPEIAEIAALIAAEEKTNKQGRKPKN